MTVPWVWLDRFDAWTAEGAAPRVAPGLVHKARPDNVLVSRVERAPAPDSFAVQLVFDPAHPFFFEHPCDHVPGLALIEAGRQSGLVVAHRFYEVPTDGVSFFVRELVARFDGFAELDAPVFGYGVVTDVRRKRGRVASMRYTGHYLQRGASVGTLTGEWTIVDAAVMARVRRGAT